MIIETRHGGLCNIDHPASGGPCPNKATWRVYMELDGTEHKGWVGFCTEHAKMSFSGETKRARMRPEHPDVEGEGDDW